MALGDARRRAGGEVLGRHAPPHRDRARPAARSGRCCCSTSPGRGVDPEALRRIWDEIAARAATRGTSVIVTTHQPEEAERCHRIAVLDGGRLAALGTPDELRARGRRRRRARARRAPDEIRATVHGAAGLAGRVIDGDVVFEAPQRPRARAAHRRAVPARAAWPASRPAARPWPTCSRSSPARGWRRRRARGWWRRWRGAICAGSSASPAASSARPRSR